MHDPGMTSYAILKNKVYLLYSTWKLQVHIFPYYLDFTREICCHKKGKELLATKNVIQTSSLSRPIFC